MTTGMYELCGNCIPTLIIPTHGTNLTCLPFCFLGRLLAKHRTQRPAGPRSWIFAAPAILLEDQVVQQADGAFDPLQVLQSQPAARRLPRAPHEDAESAGGWFADLGSLLSLSESQLQPVPPSMGGCCAAEARTFGDAESDAGSVASNTPRLPSTERQLRRGLQVYNQRPDRGVVLPERMINPFDGHFVAENIEIRMFSGPVRRGGEGESEIKLKRGGRGAREGEVES